MLQELAGDFSTDKLKAFFRSVSQDFRLADMDYSYLLEGQQEDFINSLQAVGEIPFDDINSLIIVAGELAGELTSRSSKKKQYEIAKKILKETRNHTAGIFVFYDQRGNFRFSLVTIHYLGTKRQFSSYKRYTFFVSPELANKTFVTQIAKADFSDFESIREAFSLEAVTDEFYNEFIGQFFPLAEAMCGTDDIDLKQDFALLFVIRIIFLGFVQKRGWLGEKADFLQYFFDAYIRHRAEQDMFYRQWLEPLFFEALSVQSLARRLVVHLGQGFHL